MVKQNVTVGCFITELVLKIFLGVKPFFDCSVPYCAVLSSLSGGLIVVIRTIMIIIISSSYLTILCKVSQSAFQGRLVCNRRQKLFSSGSPKLV